MKMDNEILFTEKQKFNQWWLWSILIVVNALLLFGVFKQVIGGEQFGSKPMSNSGINNIVAKRSSTSKNCDGKIVEVESQKSQYPQRLAPKP